MRLRCVIGLVAGALVLAACSGGSGGSGSSARTVSVDDGSSPSSVALHVGDRLVVTLHSTYWEFAAPAPSPGPLRAVGEPTVAPDLQCRPVGSGCGTVRATYVARAQGRAVVAAHRTTCGEALRCGPGDTDWSVSVKVTA